MKALLRLSSCLLVAFISSQIRLALCQTYCRGNKGNIPHQQTIWQDGFPTNEDPFALCEGNIELRDNGEICINGRVNFEQVEAYVQNHLQLGNTVGIRAPNSKTISLQGLLITGSGNVIFGTETNFFMDYITSYTIAGKSYQGNITTLTDNTLAASRGLIDQLCLDPSFLVEHSLYKISHKAWLPSRVDIDEMRTADTIYVGALSIMGEYLEASNRPPIWGTITNSIFSLLIAGSAPFSFTYQFLPALNLAGIFRCFVGGTVSTKKFPQALQATDAVVENVQIDVDWNSLMVAMEDGLFTTPEAKVSLNLGVILKKVVPTANPQGCWTRLTAAVDIQAPSGQAQELDEFVSHTVLPRLIEAASRRGRRVGMHMGKRIVSSSHLLQTSLETYHQGICGVQLDLSPDQCYHPACTRTTTLSSFTYPEELYE